MNILITSCGRRTKLIEYFKNEFNGKGNVVVTDCDNLAPALYFADKFYITSRIDNQNYINELLEICKKEKIKGIMSLIDPELSLLAKNSEKFEEIGVKIIGSNYETTELCFDKYEFFKFLSEFGFKCAKTYISLDKFKDDYNNGKIKFPVFIKPRTGSASLGINKVDFMEHLELLYNLFPNMIIQEFIPGQEYGVDAYIDLISNEVISIFAKKKIRMRSGETDKAVSVKNENLFNIIEQLVRKLNLRGTVDIDVFESNGEWIISEINPRFGGGHLLAYECKENYPKFILNNLNNDINDKKIGEYKSGVFMIKHDTLIIK
ncbi:MAG: ATP-grasp domain-containing protein [Clostridium perfringens]|uniref:ATP-grasp domain-containing protein n=1 Tax=Clostridium perfringens TaxID=1502 RepID=UPI00016BC655|nr:ATP-grasp domain-containing protein [Clostridium perfringens]EDT28062.1 carbamoylphosphate synthase, large subunit [Clostridium perfringens CPE str. F4969]EHA6440004.1 ATP-grasp domain-containing protein [Clostridium perfringens]MDB2044164.1 ATP-grasp domain-containing protein [Clostridium perfringens]MDB2056266.1 ATP-grasp domain-containing protein [Clostridium perfringens]MDM0677644.1 ATP-grasp domain-containing protein [Clostridium perfringens]